MLGSTRKKPAKEVTPAQAGLVLGVVFLVVYGLTRTRDLGGDDTVFAQTVEAWLQHGSLGRTFFHPHHVLYNPLVALATACGRIFIPSLLAVDAGAYLSAALGAAAVGLLTAFLMRRGSSTGTAMLTGAVMGLAGGFWTFSTRMEVYTLAALAVVVWLGTLSREAPTPGSAGGAMAFALLSHLAMVVLAPATFFRTAPPARRRAAALTLGLGFPAVVLAVVFSIRLGLHPAQWLHDLLPSSSGRYLQPNLSGPPRALRDLLWWGWYHGTPVLTPMASHLFDAMELLAEVLVALLLILGMTGVRSRRQYAGPAATALLGLCGFLALWLVWDTGNVEHTVASAPLWAVLLAAGAERLPRRIGPAVLGLLALCLAAGNGLGSAIPQSRPENGRVWVMASFVSESVPQDALLLSVGKDARLRLGLPYLSGRHVADLTMMTAAARRQDLDPRLALDYWLQRAEAAGTVWLLPDVLDPGTEGYVEGLGIPADDWRRAVSLFRVVTIRTLPPDGVVLRRPFELALAAVRHGTPVSH